MDNRRGIIELIISRAKTGRVERRRTIWGRILEGETQYSGEGVGNDNGESNKKEIGITGEEG
jgi:hypothetical protein